MKSNIFVKTMEDTLFSNRNLVSVKTIEGIIIEQSVSVSALAADLLNLLSPSRN
jgi:hypothetical protein